jgi:CheY-like chemotaxis protein
MCAQSADGRPRVLVVDDDADTVEATARLLGLFGALVDRAYGGQMAIDHARAVCPDLVLVDLAMPDVNGYDVARALRDPALPTDPTIVAVSGYGRRAEKQRCAEAGFDLHFIKPVDPALFQQLVESSRNAQRLHEPRREHLGACRDLVLARLDMMSILIQTADVATSPQERDRYLQIAQKAHDAVVRMSRNIVWPDEYRFRLDKLSSVLRRALRL